VLARLSKTLSTNAAIVGLTALVLGAGGTTATLAAGSAPDDHASDTAKQKVAEDADKPADADDAADGADEAESADEQGARPTDTHGYCVSTAVHAAQETLAKAAEANPDAEVNRGQVISAAAHSCGEDAKHAEKRAEKKAAAATRAAQGKAHAKHATGKPTG
jgi:hypothetical protein